MIPVSTWTNWSTILGYVISLIINNYITAIFFFVPVFIITVNIIYKLAGKSADK